MKNNNQHYFDEFPDVKVKIQTISESLRRHLYIFKTITGVFSFSKIDLGTKVLVEHMIISKEPSIFLDLGCGYGPIGIILGYESPDSLVYLIDINKRAVWCTKENIKINLNNTKKNIQVLQGNYFEPLQKKNVKFDTIYMNPPLRQGRKEFLQLFEVIPSYLKPQGSFQFVIKKKMGAQYVLDYINQTYPNNHIEIICKRSGYWVFRYCIDIS
ncbi:MAG: class I SAM-dependent methyltransferase [Candidatus Lokiarchaeota archaeon]|nr:class I SAM-dependent methyltransferase [Candidatus Lokiarchaeota archaeon]